MRGFLLGVAGAVGSMGTPALAQDGSQASGPQAAAGADGPTVQTVRNWRTSLLQRRSVPNVCKMFRSRFPRSGESSCKPLA